AHISQPNLAGNRNSPSQDRAPAGFAPLAGFPVQSGEPSDRRIYEFPPTGDKWYGGIVSEVSSSSPPADTHYDTIEPSYLPQSLGILNQQAPSKPGPHYDFTSVSTYNSKPGTT